MYFLQILSDKPEYFVNRVSHDHNGTAATVEIGTFLREANSVEKIILYFEIFETWRFFCVWPEPLVVNI